MSSAILGRLQTLITRNEFLATGGTLARIGPTIYEPLFSELDWRTSAALREALDAAAMVKSARFLASIVADGKTRTFEIDRDLAISLQSFSSLSVTASGK